MNNLSQFKKGLKDYKSLKLIKCSFDNKLLGVDREIALVDTVQFALWTDYKGEKRRSYIYYPKAIGYSYNEKDNTFTFKDEDYFFTYLLIK